LKYQCGLALGVLVLMSLSGLFSTALLGIFPALEPILRYVGAAYILYLAYGILKASHAFTEKKIAPLGIGSGFMLQILNPKLMVYAFSLFSTFLASTTGNFSLILMLAIILAAVSFCATSTWALFGTGIKAYLQDPRWRIAINIALSLALIYSALSLIGLF
jgi:cysteine/O-acetylserine efflux protein